MNYLPNGENDVTEYQAQPIPLYQPRKRLNVGKWLFIAALGSVGVFCFLALPEANTAVPADDYQQAIDAVQLDNVENEQLLQTKANNSNINTLNDISAQATRSAYERQDDLTRNESSTELYVTRVAADAAGQVAVIKANAELTSVRTAALLTEQQISQDTRTQQMAFVVVIALLSIAVAVVVKYEPVKVDPAPKLEAGDDPATVELFRMIQELAAKMDAKERETANNSDNYNDYEQKPAFSSQIIPHLDTLRGVGGLSDSQISTLPLRAEHMKNGVPAYAASAVRRLRSKNPATNRVYMNRSAVTDIFGMSGTNSIYYDEAMK